MKRIVASLLFLNVSVIHVARADINLARRLEMAAQDSAKDHHRLLIKIETHGIDAFLENLVADTGLRSETVSFLRKEIYRAKHIPAAQVDGYSLVFNTRGFKGDIRLTALPSGKLLLSVLDKKTVWTPSADPRTDYAALLPFVESALASQASQRTSWLHKLSDALIPSAYAIEGGTLVAIAACLTIVIGGIILVRNANKRMEDLKRSTEAQIAKTGETVRGKITEVADAATGALNKAGDAVTNIGNSVSTNLTTVASSAAGVLDSSRAALDAATAQINGLNTSGVTSPTNGVVSGALSNHI